MFFLHLLAGHPSTSSDPIFYLYVMLFVSFFKLFFVIGQSIFRYEGVS